jgi:guanylate kinase
MTQRLLGNLAQGLVFIVSAPTGTGKTTLIQMLQREFSCVVPSISYTTRSPRADEIDGVHYHFIKQNEFKEMIERGELLEYVELYGQYYGTSRIWMEEQLRQGKHVVLVIDTQGARYLRDKIQAISVFLSPPSIDELERRLRSRQTDCEEGIAKRMAWVKEEMLAKNEYDYLIINDDLSIAYQALRSILIAEEHRIR